jgi:hypothetical protein
MKFSRNRAEAFEAWPAPNERRPDVRASDRQIKANERSPSMDSLTVYRPNPGLINKVPARVRVDAPMPVTGQSLSRKRNWQPHERDFWAADLYSGAKRLIKPTLAQAASLTGAGSTSSVWWALQRESVRQEIMNGWMPLVPPRALKSKAPISDPEIIDFVRTVGLERVLDAAVVVEAAQ